MLKTFAKLVKNTNGASAAEYALIVAVLGGLVIAGATAFGNGLNTANKNNADATTKVADGTF